MTPARERKVVLDLRREIDVDVFRTERANHAPRIASDIVEHGEHDLIIACGGDGTANEVLNGMQLGQDTAEDRPAFAIVPAGGTNVMSRSLGHPNHPIKAIKHVLRGIANDDARVVNLASVDERVFMFSAGVGFDAEVVKRIELRRTGRRPSDLAHVAAMLGIYASERFRLDPSMTITVDDSGEQLRGAMVVVGNTTPMTYVGRMPLHFMPDCSLDTHLDFVAPEEANAAFTIGKFMEGLRVKPRGAKSAEKMQLRHDIRSITIECEEPMPVQADGEYLGDRTHITFSSIENAVRFIA